jgi:hypothetical protein
MSTVVLPSGHLTHDHVDVSPGSRQLFARLSLLDDEAIEPVQQVFQGLLELRGSMVFG